MTIHGLNQGQKPALVICECQRNTTDPEIAGRAGLAEQAAERGIIPNIARLADACRKNGVPVIHCTVAARKDWAGWTATCLLAASVKKGGQMCEGNPAADIHPGLTPKEGDFVIQRLHGLSGFHDTELDSILRGLGVQTLILTGVSTNIMLPGTSLEAVNRGYYVVLPEDCTAGASPETHDFQIRETLRLLTSVTTSGEVMKLLKDREAAA